MNDDTLLADPEEVLIARLAEALPGIEITSVDDLESAQERVLGSRSEILVTLAREVTADTAGDVTLIDMQYAAILCVPTSDLDRRRDFNLRRRMTKALAGYEPSEQHFASAFRRVGSVVRQKWANAEITAYGMLFGVAIRL